MKDMNKAREKYDQKNERKESVIERKTKRGRRGTNNKRAAVAQRGCQVQSGVGRQDSQGAVTGGESWETCVSCLPRLQTTSLCFTGPFFPPTHRQPPPPTPIHPLSTTPKKTQRGYLHTCERERGVTNRRGDGGGEAEANDGEMRAKVEESQIIEKQTDEDGERVTKCSEREKRRKRSFREGGEKIMKKKIESDETQLWNLKRKQWQQTRLLSGMGWRRCTVIWAHPHF